MAIYAHYSVDYIFIELLVWKITHGEEYNSQYDGNACKY